MNEQKSYTQHLFVDCANGVGALWVEQYLKNVDVDPPEGPQPKVPSNQKDLILYNTDTQGNLLNYRVKINLQNLNIETDLKLPPSLQNSKNHTN